MTFADVLASRPTPSQPTRCRIGQILDQVEAERSAEELEALTTIITSWKTLDAGDALRAEGFAHDSVRLTEHRNRRCACYRRRPPEMVQ